MAACITVKNNNLVHKIQSYFHKMTSFDNMHDKNETERSKELIGNKKRRNATKPGFQRFNQVLI